jgi:hypothetical protein
LRACSSLYTNDLRLTSVSPRYVLLAPLLPLSPLSSF